MSAGIPIPYDLAPDFEVMDECETFFHNHYLNPFILDSMLDNIETSPRWGWMGNGLRISRLFIGAFMFSQQAVDRWVLEYVESEMKTPEK